VSGAIIPCALRITVDRPLPTTRRIMGFMVAIGVVRRRCLRYGQESPAADKRQNNSLHIQFSVLRCELLNQSSVKHFFIPRKKRFRFVSIARLTDHYLAPRCASPVDTIRGASTQRSRGRRLLSTYGQFLKRVN